MGRGAIKERLNKETWKISWKSLEGRYEVAFWKEKSGWKIRYVFREWTKAEWRIKKKIEFVRKKKVAGIMEIALEWKRKKPHDWQDFVGIITLLFKNSTGSFIEENNVGEGCWVLMARLAPEAKVIWDGKWSEEDASILIPSDIISIKLGDILPVNAHLLDGDPLKIDQSALTVLKPSSLQFFERWVNLGLAKLIHFKGLIGGLAAETSFHLWVLFEMVYFHSSISGCNSVDQSGIMAIYLNYGEACSKSR